MKNYTRLCFADRRRIAIFLEMGLKPGAIAKRLGRHRSAIYNEISKNRIEGKYLPSVADHNAHTRRSKRQLKLQSNDALYQYVCNHLKQGWSPEQIAGYLKNENREYYVCHETIYSYIYHHGNKELYQYLPYKKPKRQKRFARKKQKCRFGENRLVTKRPKNIEKRKTFGHWEGDLIEFSNTKQKTVTTLVERKSRFVKLIKNPTKHSEGVMSKIRDKFYSNKLPANARVCKSITVDQGSEFAYYRIVESVHGCRIYYCEPHSPWQKGSNENMNGRLRRYLPGSIDIDSVSQEHLDILADRMNNIPRKCLGFRKPKEIYFQHLKYICRARS
jgi:transposase, IS30 family